MQPVPQETGHVAYLPCGCSYTMPLLRAMRLVVYYARPCRVRLPLLSVQNAVTYTHHQNNPYVTLFAEIGVIH